MGNAMPNEETLHSPQAPGRRSVEANSGGSLREALDDFLELKELVAAARDDDQFVHDQPRMVSRFYDVVTKFYEYGWGTSFHFAPRLSGEGLHAAQRRQEAGVAEILNLGPGTRVADIGCGVGGPAISIARICGASVTGLNFNAYQIARCRRAARRAGLADRCDFLLANYSGRALGRRLLRRRLLLRGHLSCARQESLPQRDLASAPARGPGRPDRVVHDGHLRRERPHTPRPSRPDRVRERNARPAHDRGVRRRRRGSGLRASLEPGPGPRERSRLSLVPVASGTRLFAGFARPRSRWPPVHRQGNGAPRAASHRAGGHRRGVAHPECGRRRPRRGRRGGHLHALFPGSCAQAGGRRPPERRDGVPMGLRCAAASPGSVCASGTTAEQRKTRVDTPSNRPATASWSCEHPQEQGPEARGSSRRDRHPARSDATTVRRRPRWPTDRPSRKDRACRCRHRGRRSSDWPRP